MILIQFKNCQEINVGNWGPLIVRRDGEEVRVQCAEQLKPGDLLEVIDVLVTEARGG